MKTVIEYLDDLKEKTGSDYRSAKMLNIEKSSISMIRSRGKMSDETAIKMADILGIDRNEVLIAAAIARSHGEVKTAWESMAKMAGITAGTALGGVFMLVGIGGVMKIDIVALSSAMCIMLNNTI